VANVVGAGHPANAATRWIGRTFLRWCLGFALAIAFLICTDSLGLSGLQSPLALGMGLGVGWSQARLLPTRPEAARRWIVSTALGLAAPFATWDVLRLSGVLLPYSLAGFVAVGGVLVGLLQQRLLRDVARAGWWAAITPIGWLLAGSTVWINEVLPKPRGVVGAVQYVSVVLSGGAVLGVACAIAWGLGARRVQAR
jgi:hypothetical protein